MEAFIVLMLTGLGCISGAAGLAYLISRPVLKPYSLTERKRKIADLDSWRASMIESAPDAASLDEITELYDKKCAEIERHK